MAHKTVQVTYSSQKLKNQTNHEVENPDTCCQGDWKRQKTEA